MILLIDGPSPVKVPGRPPAPLPMSLVRPPFQSSLHLWATHKSLSKTTKDERSAPFTFAVCSSCVIQSRLRRHLPGQLRQATAIRQRYTEPTWFFFQAVLIMSDEHFESHKCASTRCTRPQLFRDTHLEVQWICIRSRSGATISRTWLRSQEKSSAEPSSDIYGVREPHHFPSQQRS
ncbi:hypothetical protein BC826DRAFT_307685 [Russula brevipes]|nr:hypothetical protein BC826DRAFT_307685 [Russula brevipes]